MCWLDPGGGGPRMATCSSAERFGVDSALNVQYHLLLASSIHIVPDAAPGFAGDF